MTISEEKIKGVQELEVFKLAHSLVLEIYRQTKKFPKEETFGLSSQMQRAAISIGSNLAEGANKGSSNEFRRYVNHAKGSTGELLYQLMVSRDLNYMPSETYDQISGDYKKVIRMLEKLSQSLR